MKSIEQCLDIILKELVINWNKPNNERSDLKAEELLRQFDLPDTMRKHEFFRRLIRRLIKDGYVETTETLYDHADIIHYEHLPIITIEGYYFITEKGGYTDKFNRDETSRVLRDGRDRRLSNGTIWLAVGTFLIVAWEIYKTVVVEHHSLCG